MSSFFGYGEPEYAYDFYDSYHSAEDLVVIEEARELLRTEKRERFMAQQLDGALEQVLAVTHTQILDLPVLEGIDGEDLPPRQNWGSDIVIPINMSDARWISGSSYTAQDEDDSES